MINATTKSKPGVFNRAAASSFTLCLVYSGEDVLMPPEVYTPGREAMPIGRLVEGGISLPHDGRVSRVHATVHRGPTGTLRIVDEGSRNGTLVNGRRAAEARLEDGDVIGIGDSYLVVRAVPPGLGEARVPTMIGVSPAIRAARAELVQAAPSSATVLLLAESGCGKEVAANALHQLSRRGGPFVPVNCSAVPEGLAESHFFGRVAGAFTGATAGPGVFREAHGGTLFLDEVGELPQCIQPKLLRVLEDRAVVPVGATKPVPVDVRIVAATNRDLVAGIADQRFRGDLYARLSQYEVRLRPLRERREDVLLLLLHALHKLGERAWRLTPSLAEALLLHAWPFNVREVFAIAKQLDIRSAGEALLDLPLVADRIGLGAAPDRPAPRPASAPPVPEAAEEDGDEDDHSGPPPDRAGLEALLEAHHGVISDVARVVRRSRKQVYRWIRHYGIDLNRYRGGKR
jgi:DNA-binding NtrC family response regulator